MTRVPKPRNDVLFECEVESDFLKRKSLLVRIVRGIEVGRGLMVGTTTVQYGSSGCRLWLIHDLRGL